MSHISNASAMNPSISAVTLDIAAQRVVSRANRAVRPRQAVFTPARLGIYAFLISAALFFLLPLYVMGITSIKPMEEIRMGNIFAWPVAITFEPWAKAWSSACTGLECNGISVGFWNSVQILLPSLVLSIFLGSLNGYALAFWRVKWGNWAFSILMLGAFIPYPVMLYPLVRMFASVNLFQSIPNIVLIHTFFGMPLMTLLFRNYYAGLPVELFKAARIDGGGFWRIYLQLMIPMSLPMFVVATIMQTTGIWNDFILGLIFAGRDHYPITVQLNNIINSTQGEKVYNVNMAATLLTSLVPLVVYFVSGRWFVRGIAAGAVKG
jgi:glucose/mannose transport system permease protein